MCLQLFFLCSILLILLNFSSATVPFLNVILRNANIIGRESLTSIIVHYLPFILQMENIKPRGNRNLLNQILTVQFPLKLLTCGEEKYCFFKGDNFPSFRKRAKWHRELKFCFPGARLPCWWYCFPFAIWYFSWEFGWKEGGLL